MNKLDPVTPYILQIAGATDKLLDELFNSTPGRIVFTVMVLAIVAIILLVWQFLKVLQRSLDNSAAQLQAALNSAAADRKDLIAVIDGLQKYVDKAQEENSENYLMVRTNIDQLQTATLHAETRRDVQTSFRAGLENALEQILDQRRLDIVEEFQTPDNNDFRYQIKLIRSAIIPDAPNGSEARDILLYKAPIFKDGNEAGRLRGSGEICKIIIETAFPGWAYISQMYGEIRLAGYARLKSLSIIDLSDSPLIKDKESENAPHT